MNDEVRETPGWTDWLLILAALVLAIAMGIAVGREDDADPRPAPSLSVTP